MKNFDQLKEEEWQKQNLFFEKIYRAGLEKYIKGLTGYEKSFQLNDRHLRCIDEGTPGGLHLAGSDILLPEQKRLKLLKEARVDCITSHEECGAAKLYAQQNRLDISKADELPLPLLSLFSE